MKNFYIITINLIFTYTVIAQNHPVLIKDINSGSASGIPTIGFLNNNVEPPAALGNSVVFAADDGTTGLELWMSDGTESGTVTLLDINPTGDAAPHNLMSWNGAIYFAADNGTDGIELWKTNGTTGGTALLKDISIGAGDSKPSDFTVWGDKLLFAATSDTGREIWVTDGTADGTMLFKDVNPTGGSDPKAFRVTSTGGFFFVSGGDIFSEGTLMYCNGTPDSITKISDELVSADFLNEILVSNDLLYFSGISGSSFNAEPWISDGTEAGTRLLKELKAGNSGSDPRYFTEINGKVLFGVSDGGGIWVTDGTENGTVEISDLNMSLDQNFPNYVTELNGKLIFPARTPGFFGSESELYESDGTVAGTKLLKNLDGSSGSGSPERLTRVGDKIFFAADIGFGIDLELWETDGTSEGTIALAEINDDGNSEPMGLFAVNDRLFFSADDGTNGRELWTIDKGVNTENLKSNTGLIEVFPNPAVERLSFRLKTDNQKIKSLELKGLNGKVHYRTQPETNQAELNLAGFAPGIYLLQVNTDKTTITEKVIVTN